MRNEMVPNVYLLSWNVWNGTNDFPIILLEQPWIIRTEVSHKL